MTEILEAISQGTDSFTFVWEGNESRAVLVRTGSYHSVSTLSETLAIAGRLLIGNSIFNGRNGGKKIQDK